MKFLVIGSGRMGRAIAYDLLAAPGADGVTLCDQKQEFVDSAKAWLAQVRGEYINKLSTATLDALASASALVAPARARVVHQDLPHGAGRGGEEVPPVPEVRLALEELQPGLVQERGGLQRVVRALALHLPPRQPVQLAVQQPEELLGVARVALRRGAQEARRGAGGEQRLVHDPPC